MWISAARSTRPLRRKVSHSPSRLLRNFDASSLFFCSGLASFGWVGFLHFPVLSVFPSQFVVLVTPTYFPFLRFVFCFTLQGLHWVVHVCSFLLQSFCLFSKVGIEKGIVRFFYEAGCFAGVSFLFIPVWYFEYQAFVVGWCFRSSSWSFLVCGMMHVTVLCFRLFALLLFSSPSCPQPPSPPGPLLFPLLSDPSLPQWFLWYRSV